MIGAVGLYDTARFLEEASKNKDIDEINKKHDEFMIRYTKLMNTINELFAKDADSKNEEEEDVLEFEPADSIKGGEDNASYVYIFLCDQSFGIRHRHVYGQCIYVHTYDRLFYTDMGRSKI